MLKNTPFAIFTLKKCTNHKIKNQRTIKTQNKKPNTHKKAEKKIIFLKKNNIGSQNDIFTYLYIFSYQSLTPDHTSSH